MDISLNSKSFWAKFLKPAAEPEISSPPFRPDEPGGDLDVVSVLRPIKGPYGLVKMGSLIGIARPGYREYINTGFSYSRKRENAEIDATLNYLFREGVQTIVSLSNLMFNESHDPLIEARWKIICGERSHFVWIRNEDHLECSYFTKAVGPNRGKFRHFNACVDKALLTSDKVAVYCGAGRGRTTAYLLSRLVVKQQGLFIKIP